MHIVLVYRLAEPVYSKGGMGTKRGGLGPHRVRFMSPVYPTTLCLGIDTGCFASDLSGRPGCGGGLRENAGAVTFDFPAICRSEVRILDGMGAGRLLAV